MNTPNMSGRTTDESPTESTHREPSDLLNDDGTVNIGAVKSATNGAGKPVSPETCRRARELLVDGKTTAEAAAELTIGSTTVSKHARGACYHDADDIAHTALEYEGGEWVRTHE
jgi:hypothetical protein